jgi:hypothetical protein
VLGGYKAGLDEMLVIASRNNAECLRWIGGRVAFYALTWKVAVRCGIRVASRTRAGSYRIHRLRLRIGAACIGWVLRLVWR